jgi:hypothetical protein
MDGPQLTALITSIAGSSSVLYLLISGAMKHPAARAERERLKNTNLDAQRVSAIEEREAADDRAQAELARRLFREEQLAKARRQLIEHGIEPDPATSLDHTIPAAALRKIRNKIKDKP